MKKKTNIAVICDSATTFEDYVHNETAHQSTLNGSRDPNPSLPAVTATLTALYHQVSEVGHIGEKQFDECWIVESMGNLPATKRDTLKFHVGGRLKGSIITK